MHPHTIRARNANDALRYGLAWLAHAGRLNDSRNGPVLVAPGPVLTAYQRPTERVLFSALRDANPFFHLYECIWMLAGRNDAASVARYAKTMESFADGGVLAGSYGRRWREHFGFDQLEHIAAMLRRDPKTRRAVLSMWDPVADLESGATSKDVPCNTAVYFDGTTGVLNMTVVNRSNDIVWGAYGANVVHMSFLQEVMAAAAGMPVGTYYQFSNNFHTYVERPDVARLIDMHAPDAPDDSPAVTYLVDDRYVSGEASAYSVRESDHDFSWQLGTFLDQCDEMAEHRSYNRYHYPFLRNVVAPMLAAHEHYKAGDFKSAYQVLGGCLADDWRLAAQEWLQRREAKAAKNGDAA